MALSSLPDTPEIHRVWNLEQAGDEETGSLSSGADSFLDEGSDNAMRPITAKKKSFKHRLTNRLRITTKDKHHLSPAAALTPASSDDEMETSFTSYKRTGMCLTNPLYDLGLNSSADVSGAESPLPEEGSPKSEKQKQVHVKTIRGHRVNSQEDGFDSTENTNSQENSIGHAHNTTEDSTVTAIEEGKN